MSTWQPAEDPLVGVADHVRVRDAIAERTRQRDLTREAVESATLLGTMRDLAERQAGVTLTTATGRSHRGSLVAVSTDHVVVSTPSRHLVHVRLGTVVVVRPDPDSRAPLPQGDRRPPQDKYLLERCAEWVADRPALGVAITGVRELLRGRLVSVGDDVVALSLDGSRSPTYLAGDAIEAIALQLPTGTDPG